ncbi:MAG: UvrD-helicase domain-containing protein [Planctomycetota bacterium]|nr:UvrD-helicase domain-containing protein [Planctomycetota bacterium]
MSRDDAHPLAHQVLRASAGSGKTYRLATRYLALLHTGQAPRTILATTFTRKAAGEILGRVLVRLGRAAIDPREAAALAKDLGDDRLSRADCQQLLATLCASLHRVSISTLDSFFARLANSFRYELEIPAVAAMSSMDDPRVVELRAAAIEALLADDEPAVLLDLLRRLHHDSAQSSVTRAIDQIVSKLHDVYRGAPEPAAWNRVPMPAGALADADLQLAIQALSAVGQNPKLGKGIRNAIEKSHAAACFNDWDNFLGKGPAKNILEGNPKYGPAPMPDDVIAAYTPLIIHARARIVGRYVDLNAATFDLMQRYDLHFSRLRAAAGVLLFSDLPHRLARHLSGEDLSDEDLQEIYYRLDGRVGHMLLDEFQDTSPEQWRVLLPLAREITAYGDGERTFFCVGDVKQAIYGWRGGSAELFDQLDDDLQLPPDATSSMDVSFRSSQVVLDAVNAVFAGDAMAHILEGLADGVAAWQKGFNTHTAARELPGYVELQATAEPAGGEDDGPSETSDEESGGDGSGEEGAPITTRDAAHLDFVAQRVAQIVQQNPGRGVGILTARNDTARHLLDRLRAHGVEASGESGITVDDDPAVTLILSALTLADHPGDTACAFHVLHSPLAPTLGLRAADPRALERVALAIRTDLLQHGYARVVADWARALAPACDPRGGRRLSQLVELADAYDPALTLRPRQFVDFVRATPIEEPSPAAVRVMTVHKAKGLEFDVVVLPELEKKVAEVRQAIAYLERPTPTSAVSGVYRSVKKEIRAMLPDVERAYEQERRRRLHDDLSGLYVALTRARFALHLFVKPLQANKNGTPCAVGFSNASYASIIRRALAPMRGEGDDDARREALRDPALFEGGRILFSAGDPGWHASAPKAPAPKPAPPSAPAPPADWASGRPARSWPQVSPSSLESQGRIRIEDLLALEPSPGRARGSLIHTWFEQVDFLAPMEATSAESTQSDSTLFESAPSKSVHPESARPDSARTASTQPDPDDATLLAIAKAMRVDPTLAAKHLADFRAMLRRPAVRAALARPAAADTDADTAASDSDSDTTFDLWRERPFAVRVEGRLLTGLFDRVLVTRRKGRLVAAELLDFKTDRVDPEDRDAWSAMIEAYRPQIAAYREALAAMLGLPASAVAARLLLVAAGLTVDL